jgi:hypothetical protein
MLNSWMLKLCNVFQDILCTANLYLVNKPQYTGRLWSCALWLGDLPALPSTGWRRDYSAAGTQLTLLIKDSRSINHCPSVGGRMCGGNLSADNQAAKIPFFPYPELVMERFQASKIRYAPCSHLQFHGEQSWCSYCELWTCCCVSLAPSSVAICCPCFVPSVMLTNHRTQQCLVLVFIVHLHYMFRPLVGGHLQVICDTKYILR